MRLVGAALLYFALVFGAGFILGPIRVLWLEPALGPTLAVLCEAPLLLAAMVVASRWVPRAVRLPPNRASLAGMGLGALALQQMADLAVGILLRGLTPSEQFANYATPAGGIYAALLVVFAAMPVLASTTHRTR